MCKVVYINVNTPTTKHYIYMKKLHMKVKILRTKHEMLFTILWRTQPFNLYTHKFPKY